MDNYLYDDWVRPLVEALNRNSNQSWTFDNLDRVHGRGTVARVRWRKSGWVRTRRSWIIYSDHDQFLLLFSLEEEDGAIEGKKGIRPVLILEAESSLGWGEGKEIYKKVFKKPHNKADAKLGLAENDGKLEYNLKPHISDLVKIMKREHEILLDTLFSVDDVPMLGGDIVEEYGSEGLRAMKETIESRDVELINRKHVIELLGTPAKKAMAIRVAKFAMKKSSSPFYQVTFDTTFEKGGWADVYGFNYPKTYFANREYQLEEFIKSEYRKFAKDLWEADPFKPQNISFNSSRTLGTHSSLHFIVPTHKNQPNSGLLIGISSDQVDKEDLLQILKHGSFFSHALRRF